MSITQTVERAFHTNQLKTIIENAERSVIEVMPNIGCKREVGLYEFRIVSYVTGRQTGTTARVAELFNPINDVYVGQNGPMITDFEKRLAERGFSAKPRYLNLNSTNLKNNIQRLKDTALCPKRIWLDVGGMGIHLRSSVVNHIIRNMDEIFSEYQPIYIIV